jgi:hypothetical protein
LKNILLIVFIGYTSLCFSQNLVTALDHDTCLDKKFSIVFYIVLDSNYSVGSSTQSTLTMIIDTLNSRFKHICVSFENCSTVFIPNYPFNKWKKNITDPVVTANWYTTKTINFYLVDSIKYNSEYFGGYSYPPPQLPGDTSKDMIVVENLKQSIPNYLFQGIFHNLGHFFGLSHTDDELGTGPNAIPMPPGNVLSQEFVDATNCNDHGDLLCDTEADPGPSAEIKDGKGKKYIRPIDNFMSGYPTACRYTQQQYNKMARCILTKRLYLH